MRVKTSELLGAALDWAVAKCEGDDSIAACYYEDNAPLWLDEAPETEWKPSTNWAQGGPIIEREGIQIQKHLSGWIGFPIGAAFSEEEYQEGEAPLVAAMRCYVANKLGEEVDIPEEVNT